MPIPLQQFEQYIDEVILKRGLSYFKRGFVMQPEERSPCLYEATVKGTEDYTVRLRLKNETITEFSCNCPYDFGPVCKHIAAVIFYMQQEELGLKSGQTQHKDAMPRTGEKANKKPKRKTAAFAHLNENESKSFYARKVKAILKTAAGRHGFIDWQRVQFVGKAVGALLETAQRQMKVGNYQSAFFISCAVLEEMTKAMEFADDSNGYVGGNIDVALDLMADIATAEISEELRKKLFAYTVASFEREIFSGWNWHLGMLEIASLVLSTENEAEKVLALLDQVKRKEIGYEFQQAQTLKFQILRKTKGEKEAERFLDQNLSNPSLRTEAIQNAIKKRDYGKAISIAKDGIKQDAKDRPGLAMGWYDWLLKVALKQKDKGKVIEYARLLFVDSIREKQPYYEMLKAHVNKEDWGGFVEGLISDIKKKNSWLNFNVIANIYVSEELWEKLLVLLKQGFATGVILPDFLRHYEKHLSKNYANELAGLYEQGINRLLEKHTGRNHYKNACRFIRRMVKLGANEKANRLIEELRSRYPQRRALLEELDHVYI
jgi:hypothetical protein